ncbi:hypothetical protein BKA64DRAFT_725823 [Cadophora sp. MPI-SDFR-AT-0126]|nr:hypothetical protein BKA64DRAFT_725823 [Leotiomycetes sp. MPI-SDFR-AT-0126]
MRLLSEPTDKVCLTLMSRAQGVTIDTIWADLSEEQKTSYKDQMREILKQMRSFTSPLHTAGAAAHHSVFQMGRTNDERFENFSRELRQGIPKTILTEDPVLIEEKLQELKRNFPRGEPYLLTHADLNPTNIMVKDGKIEAIIDREHAGYMPWWVESWFEHHCGASKCSRELLGDLWTELVGGCEFYMKHVYTPVNEVLRNLRGVLGEPYVTHPNRKDRWLRPGFCKYQPYSGYFEHTWIGGELEHKTHFDTCIESTDPSVSASGSLDVEE